MTGTSYIQLAALADEAAARHKAKPKRTTKTNGHDAIDFGNPVATAQAFVLTRHTNDGHRSLHYWQGEFHAWTGTHYEAVPNADVREWLYQLGKITSRVPVKKTMVDNVLDALRAVANLSHRAVPSAPAWINRKAGDPAPRSVIPMTSCSRARTSP